MIARTPRLHLNVSPFYSSSSYLAPSTTTRQRVYDDDYITTQQTIIHFSVCPSSINYTLYLRPCTMGTEYPFGTLQRRKSGRTKAMVVFCLLFFCLFLYAFETPTWHNRRTWTQVYLSLARLWKQTAWLHAVQATVERTWSVQWENRFFLSCFGWFSFFVMFFFPLVLFFLPSFSLALLLLGPSAMASLLHDLKNGVFYQGDVHMWRNLCSLEYGIIQFVATMFDDL